MIPVGFTDIVAGVVSSDAPVSLLLGPEGIGKASAARHIVETSASRYEALWFDKVGVAEAREISRFVSTGGVSGRKWVGLDVDSTSEAAQHGLLKTLEEPPSTVRFVLSSSGSVLPTIKSRCHIVVCPPLSTEQVAEVLVRQHKWTMLAARPAAMLSGGRVSKALAWGDVTATRMQVLGVVKAMGSGERDTWIRAVRGWSPGCQELLKVWAVERVTGRWQVFSPQDAYGVSEAQARDVLVRMSKSKARARIGVHALSPLVKESSRWGT